MNNIDPQQPDETTTPMAPNAVADIHTDAKLAQAVVTSEPAGASGQDSSGTDNQIKHWFCNGHELNELMIATVQDAVDSINKDLAECDDGNETVFSTFDDQVYEIKLVAVAVKASSARARCMVEDELEDAESRVEDMYGCLDNFGAD